MRRDDRNRLLDIRAAAEDALAFVAELDEVALAALPTSDRRTWRALKNALSEIGEAVKGLSPELLARYPDVDWRGWAGLRDLVAHAYFRLDVPRLRPALLVAVRTELGEA